MDFAGEIAEVGDEVKRWNVGDRILMAWGGYGAWRTGAFCEYVDAKPDDLIPIPDSVDYATAASIPVAGGTAYKALMRSGNLQGDDDFLMVGGTGGVGTFAVQIANAVANVDTLYATTSTEKKAEFLHDLGADHIINYTEESFDSAIWNLTDKRGVDIVYDCVGGDSWTQSMRSLKRSGGGRIITSGATAGPNPPSEIRLIFQREIKIEGSDGWTKDGLKKLLGYVDDGTIKPAIQSLHPLEDYEVAYEKMVNRELVGKVLLVQD
jgi:alcohol dehydrogenase